MRIHVRVPVAHSFAWGVQNFAHAHLRIHVCGVKVLRVFVRLSMEVVFETFLNTAGDSDNTKSILIEQGIINKHKVTLARLSTARSYLEYNFYAQTYT